MMDSSKRSIAMLPSGLVVVLALAGSSLIVAADGPTARERAQIRSAEATLKKAGSLYRAGKFDEAGKQLAEARQSLDALAAHPSGDLAAATDGLHKQLDKARELLAEHGVVVPPAAKNDQGNVSFTAQIAPLLVSRCGNCHIQRSRGELSMATYVSLGKGSASGAVIVAGDSQGSRIVEVIEKGDMPRAGDKVTAEELALLAAWINAGAKFDGPDAAAPLTSFSAPQPREPRRKPTVAAAAATDEVQFARDVGPVLIEHCQECHGERNPRQQFSVHTFNRLLAGGDSGPAVAPGKPDESLLVKKLRGLAGDRMPLNRPPLAEEAIAKIEKWITLGARFDGADPAAPLEETVALVIARNSTHDELLASRAELAARNWRLILPDAKPTWRETPNVLVYGNVGAELVAEVAQVADEQAARLAKLFKRPADRPLVKGRMTLYVFLKRYDYGEVGTMLEHREIPSAWRGHWRFTGVDAYGCMLLSDERVPPGLVAQLIAGAYIASLGDIPRWFAEGTARAVAAKADSKDPRVKLWNDQVPRIVQSAERPEAFLTGDLPPEDSDILSYGFVKYLMTSTARHAALVAALERGAAFDQAFAKSFGGSPQQVAAGWKTRAAGRAR